MGRQAFKGIISPLILAGSGSSIAAVTPDMVAKQYQNAMTTSLSTSNEIQQLKQPCPYSSAEAQICDLFPTQTFCKKRSLQVGDPSCTALQTDKPECPMTENFKRVCLSTDYNLYSKYGQFCSFKKINNQCMDQLMEEEQLKQRQETEATGIKID